MSLFERFDRSSSERFLTLAPWQVSPMCDRAVGEDSIPKQQLGPEHPRENRIEADVFLDICHVTCPSRVSFVGHGSCSILFFGVFGRRISC